MPKTRKSHPPSLKAKVAVEAIRAHKTTAQSIFNAALYLRKAPFSVQKVRTTSAFGLKARRLVPSELIF
jgi:hypothetical protein